MAPLAGSLRTDRLINTHDGTAASHSLRSTENERGSPHTLIDAADILTQAGPRRDRRGRLHRVTLDGPARAAVDAWWAGVFDCPVGELWRPGTSVHAHAAAGLHGYPGIYVLGYAGRCRVSAPGPEVPAVRAAVADRSADELLRPSTWRSMLSGRVAAVHGPSVHHYLDSVAGLGAADDVAEVAAAELNSLQSECTEAEWREGGFGGPDGRFFALREGRQIVAAGTLTDWRGAPSDVGLITHPAHRGRGHAHAVAAAATRAAIESAGVARYRALVANTPSRRIAADLGFVEHGRNLWVTLVDAAPRPR